MKHFLLVLAILFIMQGAMGNTLIIGHRGARGTHPENTATAFEYAIQVGCQMIELDVRQCKSGEIVIIHDESVDRTTDGEGRVADLTLEQLKVLDAGEGQKIITLQELFDLVNRRVIINIELKEPIFNEVAAIINEYIAEKGWNPEGFLVSSFLHGVLAEFHLLCPDVPIGFLNDLQIDPSKKLFNSKNSCAVINYKSVDAAYIATLKKAGIPLIVYTVNEPADIQRFLNAEIAGIITDFPERICK